MKTNESLPLTTIAKRCGLSREDLTDYAMATGHLQFSCWMEGRDASTPTGTGHRAIYAGDYVVNQTRTSVDIHTGDSHPRQLFKAELVDIIKASLGSAAGLPDRSPLSLALACRLLKVNHIDLIAYLSSAGGESMFKDGKPKPVHHNKFTPDLMVTEDGLKWMQRNRSWLVNGATKATNHRQFKKATSKKAEPEAAMTLTASPTGQSKRPQRLVTKTRCDALQALIDNHKPVPLTVLAGACNVGYVSALSKLVDAGWFQSAYTVDLKRLNETFVNDDNHLTTEGLQFIQSHDLLKLSGIAYRH